MLQSEVWMLLADDLWLGINGFTVYSHALLTMYDAKSASEQCGLCERTVFPPGKIDISPI